MKISSAILLFSLWILSACLAGCNLGPQGFLDLRYVIYSSGAVFRFETEGDDCLASVAGPEFGEAYQNEVTREGLANLSLGLGVHH